MTSRAHSAIPRDIGTIHFSGIGGIGMSGIAEILHNLGYSVQGSDMAESAIIQRLRGFGITVHIGQKAENVKGAAVLVRSSAVKQDNPEVKAAREAGIPVVKRAEMLAEIMRLKQCVSIAGTHGKTTTTTMMATMFDAAGRDATVINGGIINAYGTNARLGSDDWLVAEADESDGTFIRIPSTVGVITNIDPEHMDYYGGSFENLKNAFSTFIENLPFYGFGVLCIDHLEVKALAEQITDKRIYTYSMEQKEADICLKNLRNEQGMQVFDVAVSARLPGGKRELKGIKLPIPGKHNVSNALAVIGVALGLSFEDETVARAFDNYQGVKRRFTRTGEANGVLVVDDYGHHPTEIACTIKTAREVAGKHKVIAVVQPHRFTRVRDLWKEFTECLDEADIAFIATIYAAGETPIEGIDRDSLVRATSAHGHKDVRPLASEEVLASEIAAIAKPGDVVLCLGAGSITYWANALPEKLAALNKKTGTA